MPSHRQLENIKPYTEALKEYRKMKGAKHGKMVLIPRKGTHEWKVFSELVKKHKTK